MAKAALYRHFDRGGALLYVGASVNPFGRLAGHRTYSLWFHSVANVAIEWFPNVAAAEEAERRAIADEKPRYNIAPGYCTTTEKRLAIAAEVEVPFVREFKPFYRSRHSAAEALGITDSAMRRLIDAGEIGHVETVGVTGALLVEYLRRLSSQHPWLKQRAAAAEIDTRAAPRPAPRRPALPAPRRRKLNV